MAVKKSKSKGVKPKLKTLKASNKKNKLANAGLIRKDAFISSRDRSDQARSDAKTP